jgi:hypothetical protein
MLNISRAEKEFGFKAMTSLKEGLNKTIELIGIEIKNRTAPSPLFFQKMKFFRFPSWQEQYRMSQYFLHLHFGSHNGN